RVPDSSAHEEEPEWKGDAWVFDREGVAYDFETEEIADIREREAPLSQGRESLVEADEHLLNQACIQGRKRGNRALDEVLVRASKRLIEQQFGLSGPFENLLAGERARFVELGRELSFLGFIGDVVEK